MACASLALCHSEVGEEITQDAIEQYAGPSVHDPLAAHHHKPHRAVESSTGDTAPVYFTTKARVRGALVPVAADHIVAMLTGDAASVERLGAKVLRQ